jgi:hypothetical protein
MQDAPLRQASESHDKKHEQETEKGPTLMITFFVKPLPFPFSPGISPPPQAIYLNLRKTTGIDEEFKVF